MACWTAAWRTMSSIAGDSYTIADMAIYPWTARHEWHQAPLAEFEHVSRWYNALGTRPAVKKGMNTPPAENQAASPAADAKEGAAGA